jgi:serine/threonine protein kinase
LASSNTSTVPFEIPGYRIERELGRGGMATVYLAIQENLDRQVVLKVMVAARTIDRSSRERFIKEAKIVGRLTHPHIVTVHDIGIVDSRYYIAMEYVGAQDLKQRLQQDSMDRPLVVTKEIARALGYAHARGFIHRDVKPANILFREDGAAVLSDFGIAKALLRDTDLTTTGLTATGYSVGTAEYMSPEQALGKNMDGRSDLYSLGIVLYEMLTRRKPFQAEDAFATALMHINSPSPRLPEHFGFYQPLIDRLLAKNPNERFDSAEQLIAAIDSLSKEAAQRVSETAATRVAPSEAVSVERPKPQAPRRSRPARASGANNVLRRGILAVVLLLVVGLAGSFVYLGGTSSDLSLGRLLPQWFGSAPSPDETVAASEREKGVSESPGAATPARVVDQGAQERHLAREALSEGDLDVALSHANAALSARPGDAGTLSLKEEIERQRELAAARSTRITALIEKAELLRDSESFPAGAAQAAFLYQEVLTLEPDNAVARGGLFQLAQRWLDAVNAARSSGDLTDALGVAQSALALHPENEGLLLLRDEMLAEQAARLEQKEVVDGLLAQGDALLESRTLTVAEAGQALDVYRRVLALEPGNGAAEDGVRKVALWLREMAQTAVGSGDLDRALAYVSSALEVLPEDDGLQGIKNRIVVEQTAKRQRATRIQKSLGEAQRALDEGQVTQAIRHYRAVLSSESGNRDAVAGIGQIAERQLEIAKKKANGDDWGPALIDAELGLKAAPKHEGLLALREEIRARQAEAGRQGRIEIRVPESAFAATRERSMPATFEVLVDNKVAGKMDKSEPALALDLTPGEHQIRIVYTTGETGLMSRLFKEALYYDYPVDVRPGKLLRILLPEMPYAFPTAVQWKELR